jgi:predicted RNA binding protein YcfA (HicA-like mRNA interferase family)
MDYSPKKIIHLLEQKGYLLKRINGSHHIYFNKESKKTVVVPVHGNKDIPKGTFMSILRQAGISKDEL